MPRSHQPCGTDAAYSRHYRAGEEVCGPCKAAHTEAGRVRRLAKKAAAVTGPECCCAPCCCDRGGSHCRQRGCSVCIPPTTITTAPKETAMSDRECVAEFIDGSYDPASCGCADCGDEAAQEIESRHEAGLITREEALDEHAANAGFYASHDEDEPPSRAAIAHQSDAMEAFLSGDLLA